MKKLFIFAAIATAGLFASCSSSDDVAVNDAQNPIEDADARQAIRLNLATPGAMTTRGTGTVGGVGTGTNVWAGQSIKVFMFTKTEATSTTAPATQLVLTPNPEYDSQNPGTTPQNLYEDLEMYTPGSADNKIPNMGATANTDEGEAMITDGTINYYPPAGNFDFFGYHADDAATGAVDKTTAATTLWTVPFTINGSQDLMSTKAELTGDVNTSNTQAYIMANATRPNDYYSAYAARKNVHPTLTFKHLLTRLQFSVKAGNDAAAGYESDVYTQTEADTYNANTTNVPGALPIDGTTNLTTDQADAYNATLTGAIAITGSPTVAIATAKAYNATLTGALSAGAQNATDAAAYNTAMDPDIATDGTGEITQDQADAYNATLADALPIDGTTAVTAAKAKKYNATLTGAVANNGTGTLAEAKAKAYNETLPGAKHAGDSKGTGTLTAENAVYVKSIKVLSENTKGKLAVAWTAADLADANKITWDAEQPSADITAAENRWLTLKERSYKKNTTDAANQTWLEAYKNKTDGEITALTGDELAAYNAALAALTATINQGVYNTLSPTGQAKYDAAENEQLVALTPTAPGIDENESTPADRYPAKRVGESIILSPGAYTASTTPGVNAAGSATELKLKVKVAQKVPTNWTDPTARNEKEQDLDLVIAAPTGGFLQNTSYNIILTVYGLERIEVIAVITPWEDGGNIAVGQD